MPELDQSFSVNELDVVAQSIHGETLIINLNSGAYYTTNVTGDEIWRMLAQGVSIGRVVESIQQRYPGAGAQIAEQVLSFIEQLRSEDLLEEAAAPAAAAVPDDLARPSDQQFATPSMEKYTDFEELLMLDPIHQVHEVKGWPSPKPE